MLKHLKIHVPSSRQLEKYLLYQKKTTDNMITLVMHLYLI